MRLGIDVGGTKTAAVVLDPAGLVLAHESAPSGRGAAEVLAVASAVASRAATAAGGWPGVEHVGACMPGLVDPATGWARHAVNLDVAELDLAGGLAASTGRRPRVDNDVKAAALGALHTLGPGTTAGTVAYLNVGTGLAAAIVRGGVVVRGVDGVAGEIGHLPVGSGVTCTCGQEGCLETLASGTALRRMWPGPPDTLFPAARRGDAAARRAVATLARGVAVAVQVLVVGGAELVVVGGGVARDRDDLTAAVAADVRARAEGSPFLRRLDLMAHTRVIDGSAPVAAIGAALLPEPGPVAVTT